MKWKKIGKIFDPTEFKLPNECHEFAQSPQALVYDNFVRIYFSTREKDCSNGKYLSHIAFADFNNELERALNISNNTVIKLGDLGCFDEHGIFPFSPLRYEGKIYAYTCGWSRRVSVPVETSIGLAVSNDDGLTFNKIGDGPILSSSTHEPFLVGDAFVRIYDGVYHMWYIYGKKWNRATETEPPSRVYKIARAFSLDGINWQKEERQIIDDKLNDDECQALPTVIKISNRWHMYFCYREATDFRKNADRGYRIGYAYSDDLKTWTRNDDESGIDVSDYGWDSKMMCYPHLFQVYDRIYLLYNGNEFGKYGFGLAELEHN